MAEFGIILDILSYDEETGEDDYTITMLLPLRKWRN
jgi:hypothetical protein